MDIKARMQGKLAALKVSVGDTVKTGDVLGIFEVVKMEQPIICPGNGTVGEIRAAVGDKVGAGQIIMIIE